MLNPWRSFMLYWSYSLAFKLLYLIYFHRGGVVGENEEKRKHVPSNHNDDQNGQHNDRICCSAWT